MADSPFIVDDGLVHLHDVNTSSECNEQCKSNPDCISWGYNKENNTCQLKKYDRRFFTLVNTSSECNEQCESNPDCTGWSYNKENNKCQLKKFVRPIVIGLGPKKDSAESTAYRDRMLIYVNPCMY